MRHLAVFRATSGGADGAEVAQRGALECDGVFCTIMYTRSETKTIASSLTTAATLLAAGCTALGGAIAGVVCGVGASYAVDQANAALNAGKCVGLRALIYVPISTTHLVHEPCRS